MKVLSPTLEAVVAGVLKNLATVFTRKEDIMYNVLDYGADRTGVTDSRAAFQSAVNAANAAGGGKVYVPNGTYIVADSVAPVDLSNKNNIIFEGDNAVLKKTTAAGFYSMFSVSGNGATGYGSGAKNITFRGFRFQGDFANNVTIGCFIFHHVSNFLVEDCTFDQCLSGGHIADMSGCEDVTFRNCIFIGQKIPDPAVGIASEAIQLDVSALGSGSAGDGTGADKLGCRRVKIDNCKFLPITTGGTTYPCPNPMGNHFRWEKTFHEDIWFTNNFLLDPQHFPSTSDADGVGYQVGILHFCMTNRIRILNNTFRQTVGSRTCRMIVISTVTGGVLDPDGSTPANSSSPASGTFTTGPAVCDDVQIDGNLFHGFNATATQRAEAIWLHGVTTGNTRNVQITRNQFRNGFGSLASGDWNEDSSYIGAYAIDRLTLANNDYFGGMCSIAAAYCNQVSCSGEKVRAATQYIAYFSQCTALSYVNGTHNSWGRPLLLTSNSGVSICGNVFRGATSGGVDPGAMQFTGTNVGMIISSNSVFATATTTGTAINIGTSSAGLLIGNYVKAYSTPWTATAPSGMTYASNASAT